MAYIVAGIVAALGTAAYFLIRANQVAQAGRELGEAAAEIRGMIRRSKWRRKGSADLVREIEDPRLAAAVMMCAMARSEGDLTEAQKQAILGEIHGRLQIEGDVADELLAYARWLVGDTRDPGTVFLRAAGPIAARCTLGEKRELIDMLKAVAAVEGEPNEIQSEAIARLRQTLDLPRS